MMTTYPAGQFDIAVIGAGHAGIEDGGICRLCHFAAEAECTPR